VRVCGRSNDEVVDKERSNFFEFFPIEPPSRRMTSMKALVINKAEGKPGSVYHPATVEQVAIPTPKQDQVLVKVLAGAFNHRDLFIRQSLYPGIVFTTPEQPSIFGADAVGKIVSPNSHPLYNKYVLLAPASGWIDSPLGPDQIQPYGIIGNVKPTGGIGTFAEYICVGKDDLVECPSHFLGRGIEGLSEAASCPLGGLTAYR
jgi:NADPH:quinone reductase-like Zn-dependent oxidoreductase